MLTQTGLAFQFFLRITLNKPSDSYFGKKSWFMSNTTTSALQPNDLGPACAHGASAARPRVASALQGLRKGKDGTAGINQDGGRPVQQAMGRRPEGAPPGSSLSCLNLVGPGAPQLSAAGCRTLPDFIWGDGLSLHP